MTTNDNDEIELNGIKYVRKQVKEQSKYDAIRSPEGAEFLIMCGADHCVNFASEYDYVRNTTLVSNNKVGYDELFFTCPAGHRNRLKI